jgi:hypothetical protein
MFIKRSQRVSGNAIEFGEGSLSYNQGSGSIFGGSSPAKNNKRVKKRRIYQLGVVIPDGRFSESEYDEQPSSPLDRR